MQQNYDAVVIGGGPGGYPAAIRLAQLGQKTLCVERQYWGGVCLNVGCIPSKALITAGKKFDELNHLDVMGIAVPTGATLDMGKLQSWKASVVHKLTSGVSTLLKANKADQIIGEASVPAPGRVVITTPDGQTVDGLVELGGHHPLLHVADVATARGGRMLGVDLRELAELLAVVGGDE